LSLIFIVIIAAWTPLPFSSVTDFTLVTLPTLTPAMRTGDLLAMFWAFLTTALTS
jgi:hypothetical protein